MATDNRLAKLYQSSNTVLTIKDIALIWGETNRVNLLAKIAYYVNEGSLIRLTRGVFVKNHEYEVKELANSLYSPSYISFETVLREAGVIFQHQTAVFVAGPYTIRKKIDGKLIVMRRMKEDVIFNPTGVKLEKNYSIATVERAFLDMIYLSPKAYFDNLRPINWEKCFEIAPLYNNKQLIKRLATYQTYAQQ